MSGPSWDAVGCKEESLGRAFELAKQSGPGVVLGDLNWYGWPKGSPPWLKNAARIRPKEAIDKDKKEADQFKKGGGSVRKIDKRGPPPALSSSRAAHRDSYNDAIAKENFATFPAWEPDLYKPTDPMAGRLDRVYYTKKGLTTDGYEVINPKISQGVDPKFNFLSDHAGLLVRFSLANDAQPLAAAPPLAATPSEPLGAAPSRARRARSTNKRERKAARRSAERKSKKHIDSIPEKGPEGKIQASVDKPAANSSSTASENKPKTSQQQALLAAVPGADALNGIIAQVSSIANR